MKKLTVQELKDYLQSVIDDLENYEDDMEVPTETNTYFIKSRRYMQFGSAGFVDLDNLADNLEEAEFDDDNEDEE